MQLAINEYFQRAQAEAEAEMAVASDNEQSVKTDGRSGCDMYICIPLTSVAQGNVKPLRRHPNRHATENAPERLERSRSL